ncbi:hypothetical protein JOM56_014475 [Amanita muscaria]
MVAYRIIRILEHDGRSALHFWRYQVDNYPSLRFYLCALDHSRSIALLLTLPASLLTLSVKRPLKHPYIRPFASRRTNTDLQSTPTSDPLPRAEPSSALQSTPTSDPLPRAEPSSEMNVTRSYLPCPSASVLVGVLANSLNAPSVVILMERGRHP